MTRDAVTWERPTLKNVGTPCLILDRDRMDRNIRRLRTRLDQLGVALRPHLKTAKSIDAARRVMTSSAGPATVSTLKEAERFAAAGVTDLIYAVGISPDKIERVLVLRATGADLAVTLIQWSRPRPSRTLPDRLEIPSPPSSRLTVTGIGRG